MINTVTNINPTKVKITVEVDKESWKAAQEKAFTKLSANIEVKGFRPGKAPRKLLEERINPAQLFDEAVDNILQPAFVQALAETHVQPFVRPGVEISKLTSDELTIEFTIVTAPKAELGEYKGVEAVKVAPRVSVKEVNDAIDERLKANANLVLKEGEAVLGDTVVFDFVGKTLENGEMVAFEGGSAENYSLELGSHQFVPGFEEALVGVKAGDSKNVDITFPEQYVKELAGKKAVFECKIHEVKGKEVPELTDESVAELELKDGETEIKTVEELKAFEKKNILAKKVSESESKFYNAIIEKIVASSKIDIAEEVVNEEVEANVENLKKQIAQNGLTLDQYLEITGATLDTLRENFKTQAEKNIKAFVVLQEIALKENLTVSDEDLDKEAENLASLYSIKKEDVLKYMKEDENRWRSQILDKKIHDFLMKESKAVSSSAAKKAAE